ncbi:hypothetical protein, partial [Ruminococcus callidus]|uniref:hypothetical protein n=1 Tax=Ruminococcus callidus TaxID=40519 RepID=UPI001A980A67
CRTIFVRYCPEFYNSYSFDRLHMLLYMTERNLSRGSGIFLVNSNRERYSPLGNTAQNPPDGFARNLRADFSSYCPEIPCHTESMPAEFLCNLSMQSAEKSDDASYHKLCAVSPLFSKELLYHG